MEEVAVYVLVEHAVSRADDAPMDVVVKAAALPTREEEPLPTVVEKEPLPTQEAATLPTREEEPLQLPQTGMPSLLAK